MRSFRNLKLEIRNSRVGFTLIELIVVMTIIMVISVVGLVNFSGTNKKARDSRRVADLEKIRVALEMIRQVGSTYPVADVGTSTPTGLVPNYIQALPTDPKGYSYIYIRGATNYTYTLDAQMEDMGSTNGTGAYGNNCGGSCNYRVTNP